MTLTEILVLAKQKNLAFKRRHQKKLYFISRDPASNGSSILADSTGEGAINRSEFTVEDLLSTNWELSDKYTYTHRRVAGYKNGKAIGELYDSEKKRKEGKVCSKS
jgi:hypothetical protein